MVGYINQTFIIYNLLIYKNLNLNINKRVNLSMNIKKLIGHRIKELRKSRHFSQEQLAEMLDISQNALSYIETGENFFSSDTLEKLINALEIEPQELMTFAHLQSSDKLLNEIVEMLNKNPEKIKDIYKITKAITC